MGGLGSASAGRWADGCLGRRVLRRIGVGGLGGRKEDEGGRPMSRPTHSGKKHQPRDGYRPTSAMMKFIAMYGIMLLWDWLPPVLGSTWVAIDTMLAVLLE